MGAATMADQWLNALRHLSVEELLLPVLLQLAVIIVTARCFAVLLRRLGQPSVVGEIVAGLILGPSVCGRLFPETWRVVFHPGVPGLPPELADPLLGTVLTVLSEIGLVLLLFLIGLEFDFGHLRWHGRAALAIAVAGIALPFALGVGLAALMHPLVAGDIPALGFTLFLGTALSITAIPVLGRIMMELNITRTRLGAITVAAAAVDDALGWILLTTITAVVRAEFDPLATLRMAAATVGFALVMTFLGRPVLCRWARRGLRPSDGELSVNHLAVLLALIFACGIVTNRIGIFAVFGAFFLGAVLSGEHAFRQALSRRLHDFVTAFFLPIFFCYTGLRTDVGSLGSGLLWGLSGLVLAAAVLGKLGGCALAARLGGFSAREAGCVGTLMNTRGLMTLIVVNLGKDLGVVPDSVFGMLVLMALATTVLTTPLLLRLMRGTELEPFVLKSGFVASPSPRAEPTAARQR
jgi:Kef-type K+ transport system membrane component KefB